MLEALDLVGRLVVAGAFAWAAPTKLADLPGLRATLYLSRVTRPWVPQVSFVLPLVELALAVLLVGRGTAWAGALGSAGLLVAFTVFLALDRHAGEGCACFGRSSRATSRGVGIARNAVLVTVLLPALLRGPAAGRWGIAGPWVVGGLALAVAAVGWVTRREQRSRGRRRAGRPLAGPSAGPSGAAAAPRRPAPAFSVRALSGEVVSVPGRTGPLVFVEPGCSACAEVLTALAGRRDALVLVGVRSGEEAAVAAVADAYGLSPDAVAADVGGAIADAYGVTATPSACVVAPDGTAPERPAAGPATLQALGGAPDGGAPDGGAPDGPARG